MSEELKSQKERIADYIEEYIEKFVKDEIILTAGEIRNWPVVDELCQNTNASNVCNAMKSVGKYNGKVIGGKNGSTSFKMKYAKEKN